MKRLSAFLAVLVSGSAAYSAQYHVLDTIGQGVEANENYAATELVRSTVLSMPGESVVDDQFAADFVLQPRLMRLGDSYILTVEKRRDNETVYAAQLKANSIAELDRAARRATIAAVSEQQATRNVASSQAARSPASEDEASAALSGQQQDVMGRTDSAGNFFVGLGPFISRNLDSDNVMYHFNAGYKWDVHPAAQLKVLGEANIASSDDSSQFYNLAIGGNWFFMNQMAGNDLPLMPYLTADIGLGTTETDTGADGSGFSFGTGIGFNFFRQADKSLDVLVRYALIADEVEGEDGLPAVLGASVAFNF